MTNWNMYRGCYYNYDLEKKAWVAWDKDTIIASCKSEDSILDAIDSNITELLRNCTIK